MKRIAADVSLLRAQQAKRILRHGGVLPGQHAKQKRYCLTVEATACVPMEREKTNAVMQHLSTTSEKSTAHPCGGSHSSQHAKQKRYCLTVEATACVPMGREKINANHARSVKLGQQQSFLLQHHAQPSLTYRIFIFHTLEPLAPGDHVPLDPSLFEACAAAVMDNGSPATDEPSGEPKR
jgi:hypothetical protein